MIVAVGFVFFIIGLILGCCAEHYGDSNVRSYGCTHDWGKWRIEDCAQIRECKKCGLKVVLERSVAREN